MPENYEEDDDFTAEEMKESDAAMLMDDDWYAFDEEPLTDDDLADQVGTQFEDDDEEEEPDDDSLELPGNGSGQSAEPKPSSKAEADGAGNESGAEGSEEPSTEDNHQPEQQKLPFEDEAQVKKQESVQVVPVVDQKTIGRLEELIQKTELLMEANSQVQTQLDECKQQLAEAIDSLETLKQLESRSAKQITSSAKIFDQAASQMKVAMKKGTEETLEEVSEKATDAVVRVAEKARDHILQLEKESMKRSQSYFKIGLPQKVLSYMKWIVIIFAFSLALAFILERVL